jgi:hypothetical protein
MVADSSRGLIRAHAESLHKAAAIAARKSPIAAWHRRASREGWRTGIIFKPGLQPLVWVSHRLFVGSMARTARHVGGPRAKATREGSANRRNGPSLGGEPERLNGFCYDWLLWGYRQTFSQFNRGVVTTYALEVGAAGDRDNRDQLLSALRAARYSIHEIPPDFAPITRNWNFCSIRLSLDEAVFADGHDTPRRHCQSRLWD